MKIISIWSGLLISAVPTSTLINKTVHTEIKNSTNLEKNIIDDSDFLRDYFLNSLYQDGKYIKVNKNIFINELFEDKELFTKLQNFVIEYNDLSQLKKQFLLDEIDVAGIIVHVKWWQAPFGIFSMDWPRSFITAIDILTFPGIMTAAVAKYVILIPYVPIMTASYFLYGFEWVNDAIDNWRAYGANVYFDGGAVSSVTSWFMK